jgi:hypothetical protein
VASASLQGPQAACARDAQASAPASPVMQGLQSGDGRWASRVGPCASGPDAAAAGKAAAAKPRPPTKPARVPTRFCPPPRSTHAVHARRSAPACAVTADIVAKGTAGWRLAVDGNTAKAVLTTTDGAVYTGKLASAPCVSACGGKGVSRSTSRKILRGPTARPSVVGLARASAHTHACPRPPAHLPACLLHLSCLPSPSARPLPPPPPAHLPGPASLPTPPCGPQAARADAAGTETLKVQATFKTEDGASLRLSGKLSWAPLAAPPSGECTPADNATASLTVRGHPGGHLDDLDGLAVCTPGASNVSARDPRGS